MATPGNAGTDKTGTSSQAWWWAQIIGAATAVIALTVALLYGLGAISLGLVLWYIKDPVSPALAQLPRDILVVQAFSAVIFPAAFVAVIGLVFRKPVRYLVEQLIKVNAWAESGCTLLLAAAIAVLPLAALRHNYTIAGVIRPFWQIYIGCLVTSFLSVHLAVRLYKLRQPPGATDPESAAKRVGRAFMTMGLVFLAALPAVAFTAASVPLPVVELCGKTFNHVDNFGRHYAIGNLIGVSGQNAYLAETRELYLGKSVVKTQATYSGSYIAVIPVAAAQLETIGQKAECNNLDPTLAGDPAQGAAVATNAALALEYADDAVGGCLARIFDAKKSKYGGYFPTYIGDGVVQLETGTMQHPKGDPGKDTLFDVQTYADGYVADNSALDRWHCRPVNDPPQPGYYVNGGPAGPHWFIQLTTGPGGAVSGVIGYFEPGGQTAMAQTFTGQLNSGLATLTFSKAGFRTATFENSSLVLGSCMNWLGKVPSIAACRFSHSSTIK